METYTIYEVIQMCIAQLEDIRLPVREKLARENIQTVAENLKAVLEAFDRKEKETTQEASEEVTENV